MGDYSFEYIVKELVDYGPMKVKLYDGSVYIIESYDNNKLIGKWSKCSKAEIVIRPCEIKEILDD